ncbi:MAG: sulfotransferase family protein, partial [Hyphococcus sp.]
RNLVAVKSCSPDDPGLAHMSGLLARDDLGQDDRAQIHFALGKAYDDIGDCDAAFEHFANGNRLRKQLLGYDIDADKALFQRLTSAFQNTGENTINAAGAGPTPVFIVGLPRSGTSLTEQILASHSAVYGAGELETLELLIAPKGATPDEICDIDDTALRDNYLSAIQSLAAGKRFVTDKLPLNFRWIGHIRRAIPEAKIILVERDPRATCWSIFRHYFATSGNGYAYDLNDLAEYYALYKDLMAHWRRLYGDSIYSFSYERLVADQETQTRNLLNFVGLEWEDRCLAFHETDRAVATASNLQVKRSLYAGSSEQWRRYEKHLEPFTRKLSVLGFL